MIEGPLFTWWMGWEANFSIGAVRIRVTWAGGYQSPASWMYNENLYISVQGRGVFVWAHIELLKLWPCGVSADSSVVFVWRLVALSVAKGPRACGEDALFLWELEEMDSTPGGGALHTLAVGCPTPLYLGAAEVRGQCDQLMELVSIWIHFDVTFEEKKEF